MFSSITSYLFGFGSEDAQAESAPSGPDDALTTVETDGDWMLVEKHDKLPSPPEDEVQSNLVATRHHFSLAARQARNQRHRRAHSNGGRAGAIRAPSIAAASSIAALYSLSGAPASVGLFDGSWYITPPPCFTAGGPGAAIFSVAASPLENLLIEHPSMSVYENIDGAEPVGLAALMLASGGATGVVSKKSRRSGRRGGRDPYGQAATTRGSLKSVAAMAASAAASAEDQRLLEEMASRGRSNIENVAAVANRRAHYAEARELAAAVAHPDKVAHIQLLQTQLEGQKVKQRQQVKLLHRKQMERFNKVQEFESIGKRQRRKDFMRSPSGKSNNRKY